MKRFLSLFAAVIIAAIASLTLTTHAASAVPVDDASNSWYSVVINPVSPVRLLDTRSGSFKRVDKDRDGMTVEFTAGPGTAGAFLGVVATGSSGPGFLTVYSAEAARPETSNVNYAAGATVAGTAVVRSTSAGLIRVYSSDATANIIVDMTARLTYAPDGGASSGRMQQVPQTRLIDTRNTGVVPSLGVVTVPRPLSVPADSPAWMVTVTAIASGPGFLTAWAADSAMPATSTLNVDVAGQVRAITALVPASPAGIKVFAHDGANVIVDIAGYVTGSSALVTLDGVMNVPTFPVRSLDTQFNNSGLAPTIEPNSTVYSAAMFSMSMVNVTVANAEDAGFVTAFGQPGAVPNTSTANFAKGDTVANVALVTGNPAVWSGVRARIIIDLMAVFRGGSRSTSLEAEFHTATLSVPRLGIKKQIVPNGNIDTGITSSYWVAPGGASIAVFGHRTSHGGNSLWVGDLQPGDVWTLTDNVTGLTKTYRVVTFKVLSQKAADDAVWSGNDLPSGPTGIIFACSGPSGEPGPSTHRVIATSALISWA
jgi:hypothetical protein